MRVPINLQAIHLDGEAARYSGGLGIDWSWHLAPNLQSVVFAQGSALRHPGSNARDSNLYAAGGGINYFVPTWRAQFRLSVSLGTDHALETAVFEKHFANLRIGSKIAFGARWEASLDLDVQGADYQDKGAFLEEREDVLSSVALGLQYALFRGWRLSLRSTYADNHSNLTLYDYERARYFAQIEGRW